jgi:hypothetical protein
MIYPFFPRTRQCLGRLVLCRLIAKHARHEVCPRREGIFSNSMPHAMSATGNRTQMQIRRNYESLLWLRQLRTVPRLHRRCMLRPLRGSIWRRLTLTFYCRARVGANSCAESEGNCYTCGGGMIARGQYLRSDDGNVKCDAIYRTSLPTGVSSHYDSRSA